tara:strand:+ start:162 stop:446 length:285 start_codon:yes stop_codon:yes gene_type:complete
MKTTVITAPSIWASYLINGDSSGITEQDKIDADRYLKDVDIVDVVRDDDGEGMNPYFTWQYQLHGGDYEGGEVLDYVAVLTTNWELEEYLEGNL